MLATAEAEARLYRAIADSDRAVAELAVLCERSERWVKDRAKRDPALCVLHLHGGRGHRAQVTRTGSALAPSA
jgi:hypothetical protein